MERIARILAMLRDLGLFPLGIAALIVAVDYVFNPDPYRRMERDVWNSLSPKARDSAYRQFMNPATTHDEAHEPSVDASGVLSRTSSDFGTADVSGRAGNVPVAEKGPLMRKP